MLEATLLGQSTIKLNDQPQDDLFITNKAKALFIYVMMHPEACSRESLASLLWGDLTQTNANNNLRQALSHLKKQFGDYLDISRTTITFNHSKPVQIDVKAFEEPITSAVTLAQLEHQLSLYLGDFLADLAVRNAPEFGAWRLNEQERLRQAYIKCLQALVEQCLEQQEYQAGLTYVDQLLAQVPWLEVAHYSKMKLLSYVGKRHIALQVYETHRQKVSEAFGIVPSNELKRLYEQIQTGSLSEQQLSSFNPSDEVWQEAITPKLSLQLLQDRYNLHEMPRLELFYGREQEVGELTQWLIDIDNRVMTIVGIGGQGKTTLAAQLCQQATIIEHFEWVVWQPLINAPPLETVIEQIVQFFYGQQASEIPSEPEAQMTLLFDRLQQAQCLLVFDNLETILNLGEGGYQPGYEDYGRFIQQLGQAEHRSCLLITSREIPPEIGLLMQSTARVSMLALEGVDTSIAQQILQAQQIEASDKVIETLVERYSGNPLALKLISDTILNVFFGDVEAFLAEGVGLYGRIQDVLEHQIVRLSDIETAILVWLVIEREGVTMPTLWDNMYNLPTRRFLLEGLRTLRQRSLLQTDSTGFSLQNVVMEHLSEQLIDKICQEVLSGELDWLQRFALCKAQSKDYIRQIQGRIFLSPIADYLKVELGEAGLKNQLLKLISGLQNKDELVLGYVAGNILNLLIHLSIDLRGYDLSNLVIWQAYFQDTHLPYVNFAGSDLTGSSFLNTSYRTRSIAFSPDGEYLATAHFYAEVRVWRTADLTALHTFNRGDIWTGSAIFSLNGKWVAANGQDNLIYIWDFQTGDTIYTLEAHTNEISTLAFSPDSQLLASGSYDNSVRLWCMKTGAHLASLDGHECWVYSVTFSADGDRLISADDHGQIRIWSIQDQTCIHILTGQASTLESVAISQDGKWLASGGVDRVIYLWNLDTLTVEHTLQGHTASICCVIFSWDGQWLASTGYDGTIRLWNVQDGRLLRTFPTYTKLCYSLALHPNGRILASCDESFPIRLWDIHTGQPLHSLKSPRQNETTQLAFGHDNRSLISVHRSADIRVWHLHNREAGTTINEPRNKQYKRFITLGIDKTTLISSCGPDLEFWSLPDMTFLRTWRTPSADLGVITTCNKTNQIAIAGVEQTIWLGYLENNRMEFALHGHTGWIRSMAFSPNGSILASQCFGHSIRFWDTETGTCLQTFYTNNNTMYNLCFSLDGNYLISGDDEMIYIQDVHSGEVRRTFDPIESQAPLCPLAINHRGDVVASVAHDHSILLWHYHTGKIIHKLAGHRAMTEGLAFSFDDTILASSAADETIRLWNVETGECIDTLEIELPYEGMNVTDTIGLTPSTRQALKQLGATDQA